jgi:hypothetical protein
MSTLLVCTNLGEGKKRQRIGSTLLPMKFLYFSPHFLTDPDMDTIIGLVLSASALDAASPPQRSMLGHY